MEFIQNNVFKKKNLLIIAIFMSALFIIIKYHSLESDYQTDLKNLEKLPPGPQWKIEGELFNRLPKIVKKYIENSGAKGTQLASSMMLGFDVIMRQKPGAADIPATSEQVNMFQIPHRLFFMKARMFGLPVQGYHSYINRQARMRVRVLNLFNMVDISGAELSKTETVTFLNDICLFYPAAMVRPEFQFEEMSPTSVKVYYRSGFFQVSAQLDFTESGELTNFQSQDRGALQDDGTFKYLSFLTPVRDFKEYEITGSDRKMNLPSYGEAIWDYPEGPFVYGIFRLNKYGLK